MGNILGKKKIWPHTRPHIPPLSPSVTVIGSERLKKSADFAFFPILLVSRLRLTRSVCDGTLETSYWKCRQWVLRVCKLANIQIFIFYGHFGAKNHCCTVYTGISRFSIFEEVWWKVVFSVKSWETSRLYHVKEHSFGFHLSQNLSNFVKNWSF